VDVGIGLPNAVPGTSGAQLTEWARRADGRGKRLDEMLARMREIWDGDEVGPSLEGSPRVVIAAAADATFARAARFGEDWIAGGSPPDQYAEAAEKMRAAWSEAGREGEPRLKGLAYFALGDSAEADANGELIFCPSSNDPALVDLLADALGN
jgi:alkanesulfonate monooxygenase SsuD/methylene tetrahydromethanopterin reductase-like flavin-dependent oxidoreductase (luciferase family)